MRFHLRLARGGGAADVADGGAGAAISLEQLRGAADATAVGAYSLTRALLTASEMLSQSESDR